MAGGDVEIAVVAQDKASAVIDGIVNNISSFASKMIPVVDVARVAELAMNGLTTAVSSVAGAVMEAADRIDAIVDQAGGLNVAVGELQAFTFAMNEAGNMDAEKTIASLEKMRVAVGDIASGGNESGAKVFEKMGLDAEKLAQKNPVQQFLAIQESLNKISNNSERAAAAQAIFGKAAADMMPAISTSREELEASMQAAKQLGLSISEEGAVGIAQMNDSLGRVNSFFEGIANHLAVAIAPVVKTIADSILAWLPSLEHADILFRAMVDGATLMLGHAIDIGNIVARVAMRDFAGLYKAMTDGLHTGEDMLGVLQDQRAAIAEAAAKRKAQQAAEGELAKIKQAETAAQKEADKIAKQEAQAAERLADARNKEIEQLEKKLAILQKGERAVADEEALSKALNETDRKRIETLLSQIHAQEDAKKLAEDMAKADKERIQEADKAKKEVERIAEDEQKRQQKLGAATTITAFESRLQTVGPSQDKTGELVEHSKATAEKLKTMPKEIGQAIEEVWKRLGATQMEIVG